MLLSERVAMMVLALSIVPIISTASDKDTAVTLLEVRHAAVDYYFSGPRLPEWSGGAFVALDHTSRLAPTVSIFDRDGRTLSKFVFEIRDAGNIHVRGFGRTPQGTLALAGSANDNLGGFTFLSILPPGDKQQVVRLEPFLATAATIASDGTIWVAGVEKTADGEETPEYNVIRRYSPSGKGLASYFPRSSIQSHIWRWPADDSFLLSAHGRIGWYSNVIREYIEFSREGQVVTRLAGPTQGEDDRVTGAGLCEDGTLYVSNSTRVNRMQILTLDRTSGSWKPVVLKGNSSRSGYGQVFGCDEGGLVVENRRPGELKGLSWFQPVNSGSQRVNSQIQ